MSKLLVTKSFLTVAQLAHSWARELLEPGEDVQRCEQNLIQELIEDILNGRLDTTGPFVDGQRSGIRLITPQNKAGFIEKGQTLAELAVGDRRYLLHHLVLLKEAILDFAARRQLPPPSWWSDSGSQIVPEGRPSSSHRPASLHSTGKQARILKYLAEEFPDGVGIPALTPRKTLRAQILKRDPSLSPLNDSTLKKAIDHYNQVLSTRTSDPK